MKAALRIGRPRQIRSGEFECRYEIRGFGAIHRKTVLGATRAQTTQLAVTHARVALRRLRKEARRFGDADLRAALLGLPAVCFPSPFLERLEGVIDRIHAALFRDAKKRPLRRARF